MFACACTPCSKVQQATPNSIWCEHAAHVHFRATDALQASHWPDNVLILSRHLFWLYSIAMVRCRNILLKNIQVKVLGRTSWLLASWTRRGPHPISLVFEHTIRHIHEMHMQRCTHMYMCAVAHFMHICIHTRTHHRLKGFVHHRLHEICSGSTPRIVEEHCVI